MKNKVTVFGKILLVLGTLQMLTGCLTMGVLTLADVQPEKGGSHAERQKNEFFDEIIASFQYKNLELTPAQQKSF